MSVLLRKILILFFLSCFVFAGEVTLSQEKKDDPKKDDSKSETTTTEKEGESATGTVATTEESYQDLTSGKVEVWNPPNRREPFSDPVQKAINTASGDQRVITRLGKRPPGVEGMESKEVEIVGVLFIRGQYKAMVIGSDDFPYVLDVGSEIWDSRVKEIDMNCVTFEQETEDVRFLVRRMRTIRRCLEAE